MVKHIARLEFCRYILFLNRSRWHFNYDYEGNICFQNGIINTR